MTKKFFHVIENGRIERQGMVDSRHGVWVSVRWFDWIVGRLSDKFEIFKKEDTKNWIFYKTDADMRRAYREANPNEEIE